MQNANGSRDLPSNIVHWYANAMGNSGEAAGASRQLEYDTGFCSST